MATSTVEDEQATGVGADNAANVTVAATALQVSCIPRLLSLSGQGYGYAVARSLACLLQPLLLQHTSSGTESLGEGANRESMLGGQRQWRQVFGAGAELQDIGVLINTVVQLEKEAGSAGVQQRTLQEVLQEQEQWPFVGDRAGQQGLLAACLLHCIKRLVTTL